MRNPLRRKYSVRKHSKLGEKRWIREQPPAPAERLYWTKLHADAMAERLNEVMHWYDPYAEFRVIERW